MIATSSSGIHRQREIYLNGFAGINPLLPVDSVKLEQAAGKAMTPEARAYIIGGAGHESTIHNNRSAFDHYKIVPRMLRDVSERNI